MATSNSSQQALDYSTEFIRLARLTDDETSLAVAFDEHEANAAYCVQQAKLLWKLGQKIEAITLLDNCPAQHFDSDEDKSVRTCAHDVTPLKIFFFLPVDAGHALQDFADSHTLESPNVALLVECVDPLVQEARQVASKVGKGILYVCQVP